MTVVDLIERLKSLNPDAEIWIDQDGVGYDIAGVLVAPGQSAYLLLADENTEFSE